VAVDAGVHVAFQRFQVLGFYADPPHFQDYVEVDARVRPPTQDALERFASMRRSYPGTCATTAGRC
jgi:hypothetical protein